jgi:hypothetical protein
MAVCDHPPDVMWEERVGKIPKLGEYGEDDRTLFFITAVTYR